MTLPPAGLSVLRRIMLCKSNRGTGLVFKYFPFATTATSIQSKAVDLSEAWVFREWKDETPTFMTPYK